METDEFIRRKSGCTMFLGYTSWPRAAFARRLDFWYNTDCCFMCVNSFLTVYFEQVDCAVISAGGIEEDVIKCLSQTYIERICAKRVNRIGNLLVPNDNSCAFEDWLMPVLDEMLKEQLKGEQFGLLRRLRQ
ncbi:putative deoxyhypusine synthase-like protein [Leptotrombidium deliense]|uniref:Putative deoxyhypusine synthase-like protein n=1 Tax=Leptotrombidium deliense TaxID=299467 RepID=A0A443RX46_9ACAR|nr:putative deoxyhypusine synthase-like protein [Leptotrombidium deliense]